MQEMVLRPGVLVYLGFGNRLAERRKKRAPKLECGWTLRERAVDRNEAYSHARPRRVDAETRAGAYWRWKPRNRMSQSSQR